MHLFPLKQIHSDLHFDDAGTPNNTSGTERHVQSSLEEDANFHRSLLSLCTATLWPHDSYAAGCPRPILVQRHHHQQLEILHEALSTALTDIVQRWWTDKDARFPDRMPLLNKEEDLLKWVHRQSLCGNIREFSKCHGSWRPDFLVECEGGREKFRITEINARFSFNGLMHLYYGQNVVNKSLSKSSGLSGAMDAEEISAAIFRLFDRRYPLHLLKGAEHGIDIHMFVDMMTRRFGMKPRMISPEDLRIAPDASSKSGYRLCCNIAPGSSTSGHDGEQSPTSHWTITLESGEVWEEIHQIGLELRQKELEALDPEVLRQVSLRCFNDMRAIMLVHDKRMLGIVREEVPNLVKRAVISSTQAKALIAGIVPTILAGSPDLVDLMQTSTAAPEIRHEYLLKPIRSGKGDGIVFGEELTADEWLSRLEDLRSPDITSGASCVVQKRIVNCLYDLTLGASLGRGRYPLVGTYHATAGKLMGLGIWRTNQGRIIAISARLTPVSLSNSRNSNMDLSMLFLCQLTSLAITTTLFLAASKVVYAQYQNPSSTEQFYRDLDGSATLRTIASSSNNKFKLVVLIFSASGTICSAISLALPIISESHSNGSSGNFINSITWHKTQAATLLSIADISAAMAVVLASAALPRRPDVVHDKRLVDRQWTVSMLSRSTWSWFEPWHHYAKKSQGLTAGDIPQADAGLRSAELTEDREMLLEGQTLVWYLGRLYRGRLALLWSTTLLRCVISVLPFLTLYNILSVLRDDSTDYERREVLGAVCFMTAFALIDSWMEGWLYWYSNYAISLPIRVQLSNLIFEKSLRCKGRGSEARESDDQQKVGPKPQTEKELKKPVPSSINLVGVDTERIFMFLQTHFMIGNGIFRVLIFSALLQRLLGWIPFAAGLLAWALILPANGWFSSRVLAQSKALMMLRDTRLSKTSELLHGLRQIKLFALESQWLTKILEVREKELQALWRYFLASSGVASCWVLTPIFIAAATLSSCFHVDVLINGTLTPSVAFVSIGILNTLETSLGSLPELITLGFESLISVNRIGSFLNEEVWRSVPAGGHEICFEDASVSWPSRMQRHDEGTFSIRDIDLAFPSGALSVISGETGSGKTLLLSVILGEATLEKGFIRVPALQPPKAGKDIHEEWIVRGSIAYVSQTPWLENASLRDNILFGLPYNRARYDQVIEACALKEDIGRHTDRDQMELGPNGINLSGGQKWRVTLARAVYSRAEILLLEDVFSAVDTHVGAWILSKCLLGDLCSQRTRILVTHHLGLVLPVANFHVELGSGIVLYSGSPRKACHEDMKRHDNQDECTSTSDSTIRSAIRRQSDVQARDIPAKTFAFQRPDSASAAPQTFMQEEICQQGKIKGSVYAAYIKGSAPPWIWMLVISIYIAFQFGLVANAWWLQIWTSSHSNQKVPSSNSIRGLYFYTSPLSQLQQPTQLSTQEDNFMFYLVIWVSISLATAITGAFRYIASYVLAVRGSKTLFQNILSTITYVPLHWLDTISTGSVLNRFTADINTIDERIPVAWGNWLSEFLRLIGICFTACGTSALLVAPTCVLMCIAVVIARRYILVSRSLRRLENLSKSPVFDMFHTTMTGMSTIRAFCRTQDYVHKMHGRIDAWTMNTFYIALTKRWMSFRIALLSAVFTLTASVVLVMVHVDTAFFGLALAFILDLTESLRFTIQYSADLELEMSAMERVLEYTELETEPMARGIPPAAIWPTSGTIEFEDLVVSYDSQLPPVLKSISLHIRHGERIGVVGRTGAGKSTFAQTLFRTLEPQSGRIKIDGVDTSSVPLSDLRSRLAIIPQHPFLFSGTLRSNLDPFDMHSDAEIFDALARVNLLSAIKGKSPARSNDPASAPPTNKNMFEDLSCPISGSGTNLSQGQQQLLFVVRALLSRSKIVIFDEATSAVDMKTDEFIQDAIRDWFVDRTLIVIAHRLSTVCRFDRILVLDAGRVAELGTPQELWEKEGVFRSMCEKAGQSEREKLTKEFSDG
ncbi:hypothetical protein BDU57DRAFT_490977 [Ampelomyces quisqualis]|uniref:P-loop containing nucleoside triphosphate hydrolase protein n=1 Tax=Ampelomyces quisqualis TaxID=50730 RepID=A0A6A5QUJ9_AMPQU|nr:hypothetical protein BDU57DRAFT_490977 [Ampelomyces quisqualis]